MEEIEFEFISEEEAIFQEGALIAELLTADGYAFTIHKAQEPTKILVRYSDERPLPALSWKFIAILPPAEECVRNVLFEGRRAQLLVLDTDLDSKVFSVYNDGNILIDIGFDAEATDLIAEMIETKDVKKFFNDLGEMIILDLLGSNESGHDN
jgi:hypothetical protein